MTGFRCYTWQHFQWLSRPKPKIESINGKYTDFNHAQRCSWKQWTAYLNLSRWFSQNCNQGLEHSHQWKKLWILLHFKKTLHPQTWGARLRRIFDLARIGLLAYFSRIHENGIFILFMLWEVVSQATPLLIVRVEKFLDAGYTVRVHTLTLGTCCRIFQGNKAIIIQGFPG